MWVVEEEESDIEGEESSESENDGMDKQSVSACNDLRKIMT